MKKCFCLLFLLIYLQPFTNSQSKRFEAAVIDALNEQNFFANDDFFGIGANDSLKIDEQYMFAETARRMNALRLAELGYLRVVRLDETDENLDYPVAIYQVGAMKKLQGDYAGALTYFEKYISSPPPINNEYLALAKKDIDDCKYAIYRTQQFDNQYEIKHLGAEVNSAFNEFGPVLVEDQLFFSSLKYEKIEKNTPPRLYAKVLVSDLESAAIPSTLFTTKKERSIAHLAFTKNQERVYYTICDYVGKSRKIQCEIYFQDKIAGKWSEPIALPKFINQDKFTATHPTVVYNENGEELLLFSSDCSGGQGGMDIWKVKVGKDGSFSKPINYAQINTKGNEVTPFFHQATNTLFFSSDGKMGLGGYDIYALSEGTVDHAGYPLNSSFHDTHFTLDATGEQGYFSSSRQGCMRLSEYDMGCQDIFSVEFINIDLEVLTYDGFEKEALEGVNVQLFQWPEESPQLVNEDYQVDSRINSLDNQFQFDGLLRDVQYGLIATKEGYKADTIHFNTQGITNSITLKKELFLEPTIFEIDLTALTFDNETREPLTNCIMQLVDLETGERFIEDNIAGNDFYFDILSQREYRLIASLIGYKSDTLDFNTKNLSSELGITALTKRLYLNPGGLVELGKLLPLTLYFDNDYPNPKSLNTTTSNNYEELFAAYYLKKKEYIVNYTAGVTPARKMAETNKIVHFFEHELSGNYDTLGVFSETLIKYLQRGNTAVISIRGFTSPLAATDYNVKLGKRRVDCLMNHFSTYRDGMINRFIENGSLVLEEVSFGEEQADKKISENPKDRRNSVYSPEASRERKVQIVEITIGEKTEGL